jgi:hypothetical protein
MNVMIMQLVRACTALTPKNGCIYVHLLALLAASATAAAAVATAAVQ